MSHKTSPFLKYIGSVDGLPGQAQQHIHTNIHAIKRGSLKWRISGKMVKILRTFRGSKKKIEKKTLQKCWNIINGNIYIFKRCIYIYHRIYFSKLEHIFKSEGFHDLTLSLAQSLTHKLYRNCFKVNQSFLNFKNLLIIGNLELCKMVKKCFVFFNMMKLLNIVTHIMVQLWDLQGVPKKMPF